LRAGVTEDPRQYRWSSCMIYEKNKTQWLDTDYVLELFGGQKGLAGAMQAEPKNKLPLLRTAFGPVLGEKDFLKWALEKFERRHKPDVVKKRRRDDYDFDPVEKVIWEFEREHGVKVDDLETGHYTGKRLRSELLVRLRDLAGLTYREISEFSIFASLQYGSLRQLYLNARKEIDGK
jgi:hypothetical protein